MQVLLVHGLSRTPLSLFWLAGAIRRGGHRPRHFAYLAFAESYDRILDRMRSRLKSLGAAGPYAVAAHSLGGLLVRAALSDEAVPPPVHVVMLGVPNKRSRMAEWGSQWAVWRWLAGEAGRKMADREFYAKLPGLSVPYTNIAGTKGLRLDWLPLGTRLNDGLVAVDETAVEPSDQVMIVPASHTFMMNRRLVQRAVLSILDDEGSADRA